MKEAWQKFLRWRIWRPHPVLIVLLAAVSGGGLFWVFTGGREESVPAYFVYAVSAYALMVLVIAAPKGIRGGKRFLHTNPLIKPLVEDENKRFLLELFRNQIVNLGYGGFKLVSGILCRSTWIWADGLYNLVQGIIQLLQITQHRRHLPMEKQWKSYRLCGGLILVMHLTMTGVVFQMIRGQAEEYPGYMIFATAAFAFYKLISAFIDVAKDRRHKSPVDSSVRMLNLTQALFSLFSLQVALLHAFDDGTVDAVLMNSLTGIGVCLLVLGTGVYMIRRANRELQRRRE